MMITKRHGGKKMKATKIIAMMLMAVMLLSIGVSAETVQMGVGDSVPLGKAVAAPIKVDKVQTQERVQVANKAMEKFRELKQSRAEIIEAYKARKGEWAEAKKAYVSSKNPDNLKKAVNAGKNLLQKRSERILKQLSMLRARVEANKNMDDSVKATILGKLDENMEKIGQEEIVSATIESKAQLREASERLKAEWKKVLPVTKKTIGLIKSVKIRNVIKKAEKVKEKITSRIEKIKESGQDTTALEESLQSFDANMEIAKTNYEEAMAKFVEVDTVEDAKAIHAEIKNLLKESNRGIREAYKSLKIAVKEMRKAQTQERQQTEEQ